jgi:predicted transcriptional regulator
LSEKLTRREREIMDVLLTLDEAGVEEVRARLTDAPGYSTVRTLLGRLERKGHVKHREKGLRYVYAPTISRATARRSAVDRLVDVFFEGSFANAVAGLIGDRRSRLTKSELDEIERMIAAARKSERGGRHP